MLHLKRAYEPAAGSDGRRILVDRLWPRRSSRRRLAIDDWMKSSRHRRAATVVRARSEEVARVPTPVQTGVARTFGPRPPARVARATWPRHAGIRARDELHNDAVVLASVIRRRVSR